MEKTRLELLLSSAIVVLAILAIIVYIYFGAGIAFYALFVIAIVIVFYNSRLISRPEEAQRSAVRSQRSRKTSSRKGRR